MKEDPPLSTGRKRQAPAEYWTDVRCWSCGAEVGERCSPERKPLEREALAHPSRVDQALSYRLRRKTPHR